MDINKQEIIGAMLSGDDPAEALRQSLIAKSGKTNIVSKFDDSIQTIKKLINFKLMSDTDIPYMNIDTLLSDYDQLDNVYSDYPQLQSLIKPLIGFVQARDRISGSNKG